MRSFYSVLIFSLLFLTAMVSISYSQISWITANNPVMSGSGDPTWDKHVIVPCVLYNDDSARYEMWFGASLTGGNPMRIGYAVSSDGISWTKHTDPVLEPDMGTWDESTIRGARVIRENGVYKMWYVGWSPTNTAGGIGYATSENGISWIKDTENSPVMVPGSASWQAVLDWFSILPVAGEGYKMWFTGWNSDVSEAGIGLATSEDGIIWQADTINNPLLTMGEESDWNNYKYNPHVLLIDSTYHMWYEGDQDANPRQMGWATSKDGINWHLYNDPLTTEVMYMGSDPVLQPTAGQWDGNFIEPGTVMLEGDVFRLWYSGSRTPTSSNLWRIGYATSDFVSDIKDNNVNNIPKGFSLNQNYPNPFNPITTINYQLAMDGAVDLSIYNLLGQKVATLVSQKQMRGDYQVKWDASGFASGVYFYKLQTDRGYVKTRKLILLK